MNRSQLISSLLLLLGVVLLIAAPAAAQERTVISITVPEIQEDLFSDDIIPGFEEANPDVRVNLITVEGFGGDIERGDDVEAYLDDLQEYASSADVLLTDSDTLTPAATRTGYFLDMSPLVSTDTDMGVGDFYDPVWRSFQWDGGHWAVPVSADPIMLFYDPAAFDAAGLAYPQANWTMADLDNAARSLAQFNADGEIVTPGFANLTTELEPLLISLLGQGLYDESVIPSVPDYSNPELINILETYETLQREGFLSIPSGEDAIGFGEYPLEMGALSISGNLGRFTGSELEREVTTLPGGRAGLSVTGFAISSGTPHPELSYRLVKYLSRSPQAASAFFNGFPARSSLLNAESQGGGFPLFDLDLPQALQQAGLQALETAIPASELRFARVTDQVIAIMAQDQVDVRTALEEVRIQQNEDLAAADARQETLPVVISTPAPPPELAPGQTAMRFGIVTFGQSIPQEGEWRAAAQSFAGSRADIARVELDTSFGFSLNDLASDYDCFYSDTNLVYGADDLSMLRSIDPLLSADPSFQADDVISGALDALQKYDQTWAMPIALQPLVMRYDETAFNAAGAFPPQDGWTVQDFEQALERLKQANPDVVPYQPGGFGGTYLLNLIAGYGGLPLDYRTDPPTLNFTDPATVEAIREVLNLARDGYIDYSRLVATGFGGGFGGGDDAPVTSQTLASFGFAFLNQGNDDMNMTTFPRGSQYNAVGFDVSGAYISAETENTEACYQFISSLTKNPGLITTMPARRSVLNNPTVAAAQGDEAVRFYTELANLSAQPNTITLPALGTTTAGVGALDTFWLNRVFDDYVLGDVTDLQAELAQAQDYTVAFRECAANIPAYDPAQGDLLSFFGQYRDCAVRVDPSAAEFIPNIGDEG